MSELVLLHHNEPMTTSLAISEGTENTHEAILKMVRKYLSSLQEFGRVGFEIEPFATAGGVQTREIAFLNEPQATLLITFLRNSEVVVRFKVALVKAFYELRDRLRGQQSAPQFITSDPSHAADLAVAADRTFRSFMRAGRAAGLPLPVALRTANRQTIERTGMDMLSELGVDVVIPAPSSYLRESVREFAAAWVGGRLPLPICLCHSVDLYAAYVRFCEQAGHVPISDTVFHPELCRVDRTIKRSRVWAAPFGSEARTVRVVVPPGGLMDAVNGEKTHFYTTCIERFAQALKDWK